MALVSVWVPQKQTLTQGFGSAKSSFGSDSRKHNKGVGKGDEEKRKASEECVDG